MCSPDKEDTEMALVFMEGHEREYWLSKLSLLILSLVIMFNEFVVAISKTLSWVFDRYLSVYIYSIYTYILILTCNNANNMLFFCYVHNLKKNYNNFFWHGVKIIRSKVIDQRPNNLNSYSEKVCWVCWEFYLSCMQVKLLNICHFVQE